MREVYVIMLCRGLVVDKNTMEMLSDRKAYSLLTDYMDKRGLERKLL